MNAEMKVVHFAPTEERAERRDPMCGYTAPEDGVSSDPADVTCQDCRDWITPP